MRVKLLSVILVLTLGLVQGYETCLETTTPKNEIQQPKSTPFSFFRIFLGRIFSSQYDSITYSNGSTMRSTRVQTMEVLSPPQVIMIANGNVRRENSDSGVGDAAAENPGADSFVPYKSKNPKKYSLLKKDRKKEMSVKEAKLLKESKV
ncbi:uncharacterized protein LOC105212003 [Zeugodacus cucurbitae]|nr:uncharacterized protein LOC105212003 [Zeugodacus cucurbitae]